MPKKKKGIWAKRMLNELEAERKMMKECERKIDMKPCFLPESTEKMLSTLSSL